MDESSRKPKDELFEGIKDKGKEFLDAARDRVSRGAEQLSNKSFNEIGRDARNYVNQHPGTVILASFVVGLLLGALIRGSGRNHDA
jgi:ElaB/YqjD/DUF883 family membrane-anchored ribosome-binding protein